MSKTSDNAAQVQDTQSTVAKRAIEESFPIVEINRLAIPERNAFKPIYQMQKWFARRPSCVFRAILLGALKPAGTPIMTEFYQDHTHDPDTNGKVILDPFMGGGTTVVEALRLGCKVIGLDLNPVAWFIVKTESETVDLDRLKGAFERLVNRKTRYERTLHDELLNYYKTECPACGNSDADIIYSFWVKSAICTNPEHLNEQVPLFSDYVIAEKKPAIRYFPDAYCPLNSCGKTFDWEIEPAAMVGDMRLMLTSARDGAGEGRGNRRWVYSLTGQATQCPWCNHSIVPRTQTGKPKRKKVRLSVFYCPLCATVFQYRGTPPDEIECPGCRKPFQWQRGNIPDKGEFQCPRGHRDSIIESLKRLPEGQLLPVRMYAVEGHCPNCAGESVIESLEEPQKLLVDSGGKLKTNIKSRQSSARHSLLWKNNGKFFKSVSPSDERLYKEACQRWESDKELLLYPKQIVPVGNKTKSGLLAHHYQYWHQMFNPRQLLCLSTILSTIHEEPDVTCRETLLGVFQNFLDRNNMFCRYYNDRDTIQGSFARHDYQPKNTPAEGNPFGPPWIRGTFENLFERVLDGKAFNSKPFDYVRADGDEKIAASSESISSNLAELTCRDARDLAGEDGLVCDHIITDPPYAGNVHYGELADFFYVWLRLVLRERYPHFEPELCPKLPEIEVNPTLKKSNQDFRMGLTKSFDACRQRLREDGLLIFTFHHRENEAWEDVLSAVCDAGFELVDAYPVHAEKETSLVLQNSSAISYDLIHVCRKRNTISTREPRAWATIKTEIRRAARKEIERIERDVYGNSRSLSPADKLIILIGKCLQLYSRHYKAVVDHTGKVVPLKEALEDIRMLVDQLVSRERPLPSELEDIDRPSYVYLTALSEKKEIKSDEVHKATRGIIDVDELLEAGLMIRGRVGRGRTYEVKTPIERFPTLLDKFKDEPPPQPGLFGASSNGVLEDNHVLFIDRLHFLMGLAEGGENLRPWIERWRGEIPQIRAAVEYLIKLRKEFAPALKKILAMIEVGPLRFE